MASPCRGMPFIAIAPGTTMPRRYTDTPMHRGELGSIGVAPLPLQLFVILPSSILVPQSAIRLRHQLEPLLGHRVTGIAVRMKTPGLSIVRTLQLSLRYRRLYIQYLVIIRSHVLMDDWANSRRLMSGCHPKPRKRDESTRRSDTPRSEPGALTSEPGAPHTSRSMRYSSDLTYDSPLTL